MNVDEKLKCAFFVGIDDYKMKGASLNGCVNDIKRNERFFNDNGFHTISLCSGDATKCNIIKCLESFVGINPDVFVFNYSGHGSFIDDFSGDEIDNRDEVLCCHDFDFKSGYIVDDELLGIFTGFSPYSKKFTLFDCCHSGTQMRSFDQNNKKRQLPSFKVSSIGKRTCFRNIGLSLNNIVCYAACQDYETAAEITGKDGKRCGAFSQALADTLIEDSTLTFSAICSRVKRKLMYSGINQTPNLSVSDNSLLNKTLNWLIG